jgi:hypothetical protein
LPKGSVEAGYDVMIGGNGGVEVCVTDHLVRLKTEPEVLEHVGTFMQLYREEARYLERTAWVARVGLDYVRRHIVDDADNRRALHQRFLFAQSFVQTDPWAQRAAGEASRIPCTSRGRLRHAGVQLGRDRAPRRYPESRGAPHHATGWITRQLPSSALRTTISSR